MKNTSFAARISTVLLGASLTPLATFAHHSRAHYGQDVIEMNVEIMQIDWRNPHVTFTMKTTSTAGEEKLWEIEGGSTYMLGRYSGLGRDQFNVGDQVRIAGSISTVRPHEMLISNMLLPDGVEAVMLPNRPTRWSGGIDGADLSLQTNNPERSLFHVWSIDPDAPGDGGDEQARPLTAAAEASLATYDRERDDPALRCVKPGMPSTMSNPHPMHFIDHGDRITVNIQENDVVRTIYIGENAEAAARPPGPLGHSVGRWEDKTLVVHTTDIDWPYFDRAGIPLSEAVTVDERFEIDADCSYMVIELVTTDAVNFNEPIASQRHYALLGEAVKTYDCVVR